MEYQIHATDAFQRWYDGLTDQIGKAAVTDRIARMRRGLFGDVKYFDRVGELRIDHGPGYRVYFRRDGRTIYLLLCGGTKKTQAADIRRAAAM